MLVVVAATARELAFVRDAPTFCCGIGPVEAAVQTARMVAERGPSAVLHIGIAGAPKLEPPTLVIGSEAVYCDIVDPASTLPRVTKVKPDAGMLAAARLVNQTADLLLPTPKSAHTTMRTMLMPEHRIDLSRGIQRRDELVTVP